jgi:hypothetical protein
VSLTFPAAARQGRVIDTRLYREAVIQVGLQARRPGTGRSGGEARARRRYRVTYRPRVRGFQLATRSAPGYHRLGRSRACASGVYARGEWRATMLMPGSAGSMRKVQVGRKLMEASSQVPKGVESASPGADHVRHAGGQSRSGSSRCSSYLHQVRQTAEGPVASRRATLAYSPTDQRHRPSTSTLRRRGTRRPR